MSENPAHQPPSRLSPPPAPWVPPPARPSGWTAGPVLALVLAVLIVLVGLGVTVGSLSLLGFSAWGRDDGYVTTPHWSADSPGHALVTGEVDLWGTALDHGLGNVRVRATARDGGELFVGIAQADDARAYLAGVQHTVQTGAGGGTREVTGGPPVVPPTEAGIWIASGTGARAEAVTQALPGTWVAVVMPTDGGVGVDAVVDVGATLPWLLPVGMVLLVTGLVLLAGGAVTIVAATRAATAPPRQLPPGSRSAAP